MLGWAWGLPIDLGYPKVNAHRAPCLRIPRSPPMANPASDVASASAEWTAKSSHARALAAALEEKVRTRPEYRVQVLELVRKLRIVASIFERRALTAQAEGGKPPFSVSSESSNDARPTDGARSF